MIFFMTFVTSMIGKRPDKALASRACGYIYEGCLMTFCKLELVVGINGRTENKRATRCRKYEQHNLKYSRFMRALDLPISILSRRKNIPKVSQ